MNLAELLKDSAYKLTPKEAVRQLFVPAEIANFWNPELDLATPKKIDKLAQQNFTLKAQSERLLDAAKCAVKIAIEQDEAAGMAYLAREGALTCALNL